jgi:hypothetical protein
MPHCKTHDHAQRDEGRSEASDHAKTSSRSALMGRLSRFFVWWLIFSGIYASSSVCPFCGQVGCPVGGASAGLVGGLFAFLILGARRLAAHLKRLLPMSRPTTEPQKPEP